MKDYFQKAFSRFLSYFGSEKKRSILIVSLFCAGLLIFVINNSYYFLVQDGKRHVISRLIMRLCTSVSWWCAAWLGAARNRTKRNHLLLLTLCFYILGDVFALIYVPVSAPFYIAGHIFLILAIMQTTVIKNYQYLAFLFGILLTITLFLWHFKSFTLVCLVGILYGSVCSWVMAASLSNRFYWLAGLVFYISDITGFLRIIKMNTKPVYLVTTSIYYLAIFLLCLSVFNESKKEVVTWLDLKRLLLSADKKGLRLYLSGRWGINLVLGHKKFFYEKVELAYNRADRESLLSWLTSQAYTIEESADGVMKCYSEKFGYLNALPFSPGESKDEEILVNAKHKKLVLDPGFFTSVKMFGKTVPCLVPGANLLA